MNSVHTFITGSVDELTEIEEHEKTVATMRNRYWVTSYELTTIPSLNTVQQIKPADITGDGIKDNIIIDVPTGTAWYSDGREEPIRTIGLSYHIIEYQDKDIRKRLDTHLEELLREKR